MKQIALEKNCIDFKAHESEVCVNCFIDRKMFWTASYKPKSHHTKEEKTWKLPK